MAETVSKHMDPDAGRGHFAIALDGETVGRADFRDHNGVREFDHTEVDPAYGGRGLAGTMVRQALDATRAEGLRIRPTCSYVAKYVSTHHDWDDLLDR